MEERGSLYEEMGTFDPNTHSELETGFSQPHILVAGSTSNSNSPQDFLTERERRVNLNDRFIDLKNLIPNPTKKNDRASIVGEAINYIKELKRAIEEVKMLVEKKKKKKRNGKIRSLL